MIASSESKPDKEENLLRTFRSKGVDGIIIAPTKQSTNEIMKLINERFPIVTFDRFFPELEMSSIIVDNKESSFKLVSHLIETGCRKIAIITTNPHLTTMCFRVDGYKQALERAGVAINPNLIGCVAYENYEQNVVNTLDAIFEKEPDVDGFFFTTHILALEAFLYFHKKGINFNERFGLACFHSVSTFEILAPNIHVAEMPVKEIGENAVNIVLKDIETKKNADEPSELQNLVLPCTFYFND
jgi:LacI family transcriptional regulator